MPRKPEKKQKNGFTLMEIIVVIGVIISVLTSTMVLISMTVNSTKASRLKITAISLSQEGLEIVRNIRDNNWLADRRNIANWRFGLAPGDYRVQYDSLSLISFASVSLSLINGYYQYGAGISTPFYRRITLEHLNDNQLRVVSEVSWEEKERRQEISAETRLYNWLEEN